MTSDLSRRSSGIGFQPSGLESPEIMYNAAVFALHNYDVPGPLILEDDVTNRWYLGAGACFEVFGVKANVEIGFQTFDGPVHEKPTQRKSWSTKAEPSIRLIAFKRANICELQDKNGVCTSVTTRSGSQLEFDHVDLVLTEIMIYTQSQHQNLVKLLAWGFQSNNGSIGDLTSRSLVLFMEHAIASAKDILQAVDLPWAARKHLCAGTVAGIKALHSISIVHGDMKPDNVLVFATTTTELGLIAKVGDFNISWYGQTTTIPRGTSGWVAPEVSSYHAKTPDLRRRLMSADIWSLALTVWSILLEHGQSIRELEPDQYASELRSKFSQPAVNDDRYSAVTEFLANMMQTDASLRPQRLDALRLALQVSEVEQKNVQILDSLDSLMDKFWTRYNDMQARLVLKHIAKPYDMGERDPNKENRNSYLHSYKGTLTRLRIEGLDQVLSKSSLSQIFETALEYDRRNSEWLEQAKLELILECAKRGYLPAQAVCAQMWRIQKRCLPSDVAPFIERWNFNAVSSGYLFSEWAFKDSKPPLYWQALDLFRKGGGYNLYYCGRCLTQWDAAQPEHEEHISGLVGSLKHDLQHHPIHLAAALNKLDLEQIVSSETLVTSANVMDHRGDTPVMKCCMAGHIEALRVLVNSGAKADMVNPISGYTAAHWIFAFSNDHIQEAVRLLAEAGGRFNLRNSKPMSSFHLPLCWPCGSPLHWATFANNTSAVSAIFQYDNSTLSQVDLMGQTALEIALKMLNGPLVALLLQLGANLEGSKLHSSHDIFETDELSFSSDSSGWHIDPNLTPVHNFICGRLELGNVEDRDVNCLPYLPQDYKMVLFTAGEYLSRVENTLQVIVGHSPECLQWVDSNAYFPLHHAVTSSDPIIKTGVLSILLDCGPGFHEIDISQPSALNLLLMNNSDVLNDEGLSHVLQAQFSKIPFDACATFLNRLYPLPTLTTQYEIMSPNIECYRPLHFVAELGLVACLHVVLSFGADPSLRTENSNLTALDVARAAATMIPPESSPPSPLDSSISTNSGEDDEIVMAELVTLSHEKAELDVDGSVIEESFLERKQSLASSIASEPTVEDRGNRSAPRIWCYQNLPKSLARCKESRNECIQLLERIQLQSNNKNINNSN